MFRFIRYVMRHSNSMPDLAFTIVSRMLSIVSSIVSKEDEK